MRVGAGESEHFAFELIGLGAPEPGADFSLHRADAGHGLKPGDFGGRKIGPKSI